MNCIGIEMNGMKRWKISEYYDHFGRKIKREVFKDGDRRICEKIG